MTKRAFLIDSGLCDMRTCERRVRSDPDSENSPPVPRLPFPDCVD